MVFIIIAGIVVLLVVIGIGADAIARRRGAGSARTWSDSNAGAEYRADKDRGGKDGATGISPGM